MSKISEHALGAFRDELQKTAGYSDVVARFAPQLKNVGTLMSIGTAAGTLGGAGLGVVRDYREARRQGASAGQSVLHGFGGAVSGAKKGALLGAGLGAGAGLLARGDISGLAQRGGALGATARFGQRQVHGLTGMLSPAELMAVRGGAYDAQAALHAAQQAAANPAPRGLMGEAWRRVRGQSVAAADAAQHANLAKNVQSAEKALSEARAYTGGQMDLTSLPGIASAARQHGAGKVLRAGLQGSPLSLTGAMTLVPAGLSTLATLARREETTQADGQRPVGKGEDIGQNLGETAGAVAGSFLPIVGQSVLGGTLGTAGRLVGRGVDRLRGVRAPGMNPGMTPSTLEPAESQNVPSERIMSPAAAGQQPDIGL
jgi:hypothetical protein